MFFKGKIALEPHSDWQSFYEAVLAGELTFQPDCSSTLQWEEADTNTLSELLRSEHPPCIIIRAGATLQARWNFVAGDEVAIGRALQVEHGGVYAEQPRLLLPPLGDARIVFERSYVYPDASVLLGSSSGDSSKASDLALLESAAARDPWLEGKRESWQSYVEKKGALSPKMRAKAQKAVARRDPDEDRQLVEAAAKDNPWFSANRATLLSDIETKGGLSDKRRALAERVVNVAKAVEVADLRVLVADHYPDAGADIRKAQQTVKAAWRGGSSRNVSLTKTLMNDFKRDEGFNVRSFLTDVVGMTNEQAEVELLYRAGLSDAKPIVSAKFTNYDEAPEGPSEEDLALAAWLAAQFDEARTLHVLGGEKGQSNYFARKGVEVFFETYKVAGGVVFGRDKFGSFAQMEVTTFGEVIGYQRIYNEACVERKYDDEPRDKDFIGSVKGGFVALLPKELDTLPTTTTDLEAALEQGYRLGQCEGVATGMSVCLANPKTIMLCSLNAGNLVGVAASFGERYSGANEGVKAALCTWADNDQWRKDKETKKRVPVQKPEEPTCPEEANTGLEKACEAALIAGGEVYYPIFAPKGEAACPTDFNDLYRLEGLEMLKVGAPSVRQVVASAPIMKRVQSLLEEKNGKVLKNEDVHS